MYGFFLRSSSLPDLSVIERELSALKRNSDGTAWVQDYCNQSTESFVILLCVITVVIKYEQYFRRMVYEQLSLFVTVYFVYMDNEYRNQHAT